MGKSSTTSSELVARIGCKRELQFALKSQSEICGGESLGLVCGKRRMTITMSDLSEDLVEEIFSRVPITSLASVRSTCKQWNALSRNQIVGKAAKAKNQFLGFMMKDFKICSVRMDIQKNFNDGDDFIDLSIKQVSTLNQFTVIQIHHCDGLLLCALMDTSRLMVWNPYLCQRRWIPHLFHPCDSFALGHDSSGNYKILQLLDFYHSEHVSGFKIYEFSSNSWKVLDGITPKWKIPTHTNVVILKGNAYFYAQEQITVEGEQKTEHFLLCFDFTLERFGPHLSMPSRWDDCDFVMVSHVGDKQLAVLYQPWRRYGIMEIWITNKIDYNEVLWTKWTQVDMNLLPVFPFLRNFFIDEVKKVAVVFHMLRKGTCFNHAVYIIEQDRCSKSININIEAPPPCNLKRVLFEYFPSLVKIE